MRNTHGNSLVNAQLDSSYHPYYRGATEISISHAAYDQVRLDAENDASLNHAECVNPTAIETSSNHWESENATSGGTHANLSNHVTR